MESATRLEHSLSESEKNQTIKYSTSLSSQIVVQSLLYIILSIIFVESNLCS